MDILDFVTKNLNPPQSEAVQTIDGPLLILAGAGSGKTRVLTHRVANIIGQGAATTEEVLCVTFTNKAAREMEHRIYKILSEIGITVHSQLWISTFHSICVRILKQHIQVLGYKPFFTIYDSSDQLSQIKKVIAALNINDKAFPPKSLQGRISNAKMQGLTPEKIAKAHGRPIMDPKSLEIFTRYEEEMKKANALDFDDLLLKTHELFQNFPHILEEYQNKFRYIMVDEYQDTNHIQYLLIKALANKYKNLCVVGDEDQSIYSWRGADIRNILDFEKDFAHAKTVKLEENYRSSGNIVKAATSVIQNNSERKEKTLFTSNSSGDKIQVREEKNEYDEARFVTKTIEQMMNSGEGSYNDYAVFYRTNAQSRVLEEQLRQNGIPYKIVGGVKFYDRMEIKDVLAFMKLSLNDADDISLKRIINVPARGIGKTTVDRLEELAATDRSTLWQAISKAIETRVFNAGTTGKLRRFLDLCHELQVLARQYTLTEFYTVLLDKTEYLKALKTEDSPESQARIDNLEEFDNAITQFYEERGEDASLQTFLEEMALISDLDSMDQEVNSVTLMTMHISKGLEFPFVFIVGLEENLFPSARPNEDDPEGDVEEERRLCYVGMTRAREKLFLTYTKIRRVWGQETMNAPSRFLKEIPRDLVNSSSGATLGATYGQSFKDRYAGAGMMTGFAASKDRNSFDNQAMPNYEDEDDSSSGTGSQLRKGQKVRHPTFGVGSIYATEGSGDQMKVSVMFVDNTIKKFVAKYARLERV